MGFFQNLADRFYLNFIADERWHYVTDGLKATLIITFFALIIGVVLGFLLALIRSTYDRTGKKFLKWESIGDFLLWILNIFAKVYLTIIRGTPVVVQLLIIYLVIFGSVNI